ncbi:mitochondrial 28S ribosomal protein S29-like protein [Wolffia australiana]
MWRGILLRAASIGSSTGNLGQNSFFLAPTTNFAYYSSKSKGTAVVAKKPGATGGGKFKDRKAPTYAKVDDMAAAAPGAEDVEFEIPTDPLPIPPFDPDLDVRPNGRPLFCGKSSLAELGHKDICSYFDFSVEDLKGKLPEGLPAGMTQEFGETRRWALLVRESFIDLRDNFRRIVDPPARVSSKSSPIRKQVILDGLVSCGKSILLAMLVHWARSEGWLVFYVPNASEWTRGGFFYKNPQTDLWDTPVQATQILKDFLKFNESHLQNLPLQIQDPIPLGEGAGVRMRKDADSMIMPEDSKLLDLVRIGIEEQHASVGVVVRLRKELSMVKDIPVLFAIDQYNSWFTFSEYEEPVSPRSCHPIHARELSTVSGYRSMMHNDMMVGAFSHSTAVGKLRKELPDVPSDARILLPRYNTAEAESVSHYYLRQRLIRRDGFSEEKWKKVYYLSNGNGKEMRWLVPFI